MSENILLSPDDPSDTACNDFTFAHDLGRSVWISVGGMEVNLYCPEPGELKVTVGGRRTPERVAIVTFFEDPKREPTYEPPAY